MPRGVLWTLRGGLCDPPPEGKILHSLEIKRLVDLGMLAACTVQYYEPSTKEIISRDATQFSQSIDGYMRGDLVLAYKF